MRWPSARYTTWWRCTRVLPRNSALTMIASKWCPSPATSRCSQGIPWRRYCSSVAGISMVDLRSTSGAQLVAAAQKRESEPGQHDERGRHDGRAQPRAGIGNAEETAAKTVDHVEEWIDPGHRLPEAGQGLH